MKKQPYISLLKHQEFAQEKRPFSFLMSKKHFCRTSTFILFAFFVVLSGYAKEKFNSHVIYNVRNYGAKGDGKTLDHLAINKAIDACVVRGGGTVLLPTGTYLCGSIHLQSNVNLMIDVGATILGAPEEMKAYDPAEPFPFKQYQDGGHTYFHNSLIWGENLKNVSITGRGMINGGGITGKDRDHFSDGAMPTGDKSIALKLCSNVLIRDITIFHGGHFAILATGCDLMTIDNLTIDTNRDGIDIDCCTNTVVSNCRVNCPGDDAICPKSSYAFNKPVITENLLITNCEVSGYKEGTLLDGTRVPTDKVGWSSGRIKFGTESNGGFRNCVVSNCIFRNCNGLALEQVDGGIMENIIVSNIIMENMPHYPIYVCLGARNRGPAETTTMGSVRNIFISNVIATGVNPLSGIQITGVPGYPMENIQLSNIFVEFNGGGTKEQAEKFFPELDKGYPEPKHLGPTPSYGLFARHIKELKLSNITLKLKNPDYRPAVICSDVIGLDISDFKAAVAKDVVPFRFEKVSELTVRNSPIFETKITPNP